MKTHLVPVLLIILVPGCGGGSTPPAAGSGQCTALVASNNAALCTGSVGKATAPNAELVRAISVSISNAEYAGTVGYVAKYAPTSGYVQIFVPITNVSPSLRCFVRAETSQAGGYKLSGYVYGSVGHSGGIYTHTCLAPTETGYLLDITDTVAFADIPSISLTLADSTELGPPSGRVTPRTQTSDATDLSVLVENPGPVAVDLAGRFHVYILRDDAEQAMAFGFLDETSPSALQPTARESLTASLSFHGRASQLVAVVDFEEPGVPGALSVAPSPWHQGELEAVKANSARLRQALSQAK